MNTNRVLRFASSGLRVLLVPAALTAVLAAAPSHAHGEPVLIIDGNGVYVGVGSPPPPPPPQVVVVHEPVYREVAYHDVAYRDVVVVHDRPTRVVYVDSPRHHHGYAQYGKHKGCGKHARHDQYAQEHGRDHGRGHGHGGGKYRR